MRTTSRIGFALLGLALMVSATGCGGGANDRPPLVKVVGVINLNGKPTANLLISFHSEKGGRDSTGVTDAEGKFNLEYTTGVYGAQVGKNAVSIRWNPGHDPMGLVIAPEFASGTGLVQEVKETGNNFIFDVTASQAEPAQ